MEALGRCGLPTSRLCSDTVRAGSTAGAAAPVLAAPHGRNAKFITAVIPHVLVVLVVGSVHLTTAEPPVPAIAKQPSSSSKAACLSSMMLVASYDMMTRALPPQAQGEQHRNNTDCCCSATAGSPASNESLPPKTTPQLPTSMTDTTSRYYHGCRNSACQHCVLARRVYQQIYTNKQCMRLC